jgi:hypothetical protein
VAAAALVAQLPYVALPVCALALADMTFRGHPVRAAALAGGTVAIAALLSGPRGAAIAGLGLLGVLAAVAWLGRGSPWIALVALALAYSLGLVAVDAADAWIAGGSLAEGLRGAAEANSQVAATVAGLAGVEDAAAEAEGLTQTLFMTWPASYAVTGMATAILVMSAVSWVARRRGRARQGLPPLAEVDLTPHVLWLPLIGVGCLVAGRLLAEQSVILTAVGYNALLLAWPLLVWQGLAVITERIGKREVSTALRVAVYAAALLLEVLLFAVSLLGTVDIVANFRKRARADSPPRGGAEGSAPSSK